MPRKAPAFWERRSRLSSLLLPASKLYGAAAHARNALAKPEQAGVSVVCIGNLVAGGAGKTPAALAAAESLQHQGAKPFFLSRGYGGALKGPLQVDLNQHTAREVGDEALLLAAVFPTVVAHDRVAGAKLAASLGASVVVMDDGFQNPHLHKDLSLLVVDGSYGFGNGRLLPAGPLRETLAAGLARASAVLVVEGELPLPVHVPVLHATLMADAAAHALCGKKVVGFAGLGRPEKFRTTLQRIGCEVAAFQAFPDHHRYTDHDMEALQKTAQAHGARLATTAKDAVRLSPRWRDEVFIVRIRMDITEQGQFNHILRGVLKP